MNKTILLFLLVFPAFAKAQHNVSKIDSLAYYQQELSNMVRAHQQELRNDSHYIALTKNIRYLRSKTDSYRGFILYTQVAAADFSKLNAEINAIGFPTLSGPLPSVGYGLTFKKNRRIFDLNLSAFGIGKESRKDGESIKVALGSFFEFVWGYDLIKNKALNFYPYLGIGLRSTSLDYKAKPQINPTASSFTNVIQNNRSVSGHITEIGYQAGAGFEVVLTKANRPGGILLFSKGGTNRAFKNKRFDLEGYKYNPELNPGRFIIYTGFKFFSR